MQWWRSSLKCSAKYNRHRLYEGLQITISVTYMTLCSAGNGTLLWDTRGSTEQENEHSSVSRFWKLEPPLYTVHSKAKLLEARRSAITLFFSRLFQWSPFLEKLFLLQTQRGQKRFTQVKAHGPIEHRHSSPKQENSVIIYSPLCSSKTFYQKVLEQHVSG